MPGFCSVYAITLRSLIVFLVWRYGTCLVEVSSFFSPKWFIKIFTHAALSLGENEETRMHNQ